MKRILVAIIAIALALSLMSCDLAIESLLADLGLIDSTETPDDDIIEDDEDDEGGTEIGGNTGSGNNDNSGNTGSGNTGSTDNDNNGGTGDDNNGDNNGSGDDNTDNGGDENGGNEEEEILIFANVEVQGSNEAINLEFTTAEGYTYSVYYKPAEADDSEYVRLTDDLMVREGDTLKCYIVGISAGTYKVRIHAELGGDAFGIILKDIVVSAQG